MYQPRFFPLILCLLFAGSLSPVFAQDDAQLRFEIKGEKSAMPKGWAAGIGKGSSGIQSDLRVGLDSVLKQEGRYALSADYKGAGDFISVVHVINKMPDAGSVKLTGYLKTDGVDGWAGLWMRIDGRNRTLQFDNMQSRGVVGTTDWKQYEITLPFDKEEAERISVGALLVGKGKIWIDNFRLTVDGKDITNATTFQKQLLPADKDTAYYKGSGINTIALTPEKVDRLTSLGALWGFVKYYHCGVQGGNHNMDAALLRFLPMILASKDNVQAAEFMERWVDMFGKPAECKDCVDVNAATDVALKPDYSILFEKGRLPATLVAKLEYLRANRFPGGRMHYYIDMTKGAGNPVFLNEYPYSDQPYPDAGIRLLSLYRYWNMIQYFFPYRHLIGEDWNTVLPSMIPEFCNARDAASYQLACLKVIARIHDSHANLWANGDSLEAEKGAFITPFRARFIEGRLVVTGYYKDTINAEAAAAELPVSIGDVVERIDSVEVEELVKKYLPLSPGSNIESQLRGMASIRGFLLRSKGKEVSVRILRGGKSIDLAMQRIPVQHIRHSRFDELFAPESGFKLLPGNIGYIYPALLTETSLDSVKKMLHKTDGLVIDLRCYPGTFMPFTYGEWLKPKASPFVRFTTGSTDLPGLFTNSQPISNGKANKDYYLGKVVIIVNENTQSQAEYTTMALQTIPGAVTIGSTTAGADGNVSQIVLPGNLSTMISGIGVLYPDGTETQRKGVKIDKVVKPTIKGVLEGKDELLEAALRIINGK